MILVVLLSIAVHSCYIGSKVVVSLLALELGASQLLIGVLAALYALLPMLLVVYSGRLADTIGMRVPMLIGAALAGIAMLCGFAWQQLAAGGFLLMPFLRDVYLIMLVSFAIGFGMGVGQPIAMTLSFSRSPAGRTGEVTGLRLTVNNIARIVIPLTAGAHGTVFGMVPVFWMNAFNLAAVSWLAKR